MICLRSGCFSGIRRRLSLSQTISGVGLPTANTSSRTKSPSFTLILRGFSIILGCSRPSLAVTSGKRFLKSIRKTLFHSKKTFTVKISDIRMIDVALSKIDLQ